MKCALTQRALLALLVGFLVCGCKTSQRLSSTRGVDDSESLPMGDYDRLVESRFGMVCGLLMASGDESCRSSVITATCSQGMKSLTESIKSLMADPQLNRASTDEAKLSKFMEAIRKDFFQAVNAQDSDIAGQRFTKAADRCLNHQKYSEAEEFEELAATPEFQTRAAEARRKFWTGVALGSVSEFAKQAVTVGVGYLVGKVSAPNTVLSMSQLFWGSVCSGGMQMAAGFAKSAGVEVGGDACASLIKNYISKPWSKECLNVYAASCSAYIGSVDLRNLGLQTENDIANFVLDTTNLGLWGLCNAGGPAIRTSCGVINYSANQIGEALRNGDNDLARCAGTSQIGACIGQMWGQGRWTNKNGVEVARIEHDPKGQPWRVTGCCLCQKDWYQSKGFAIDPKISTEWRMTVIQSGDVASGNCAADQGRRGSVQEGKYYIYSQCNRVEVVGAGCGLQEADEQAKLQDVSRVLWDLKVKGPSKIITRTGYK
jgi:hypothetical protein